MLDTCVFNCAGFAVDDIWSRFLLLADCCPKDIAGVELPMLRLLPNGVVALGDPNIAELCVKNDQTGI